MDQRELHQDLEEAVRLAVKAALASLQTSLPAFVVDFDPATQAATCQTTIRAYVPTQNGGYGWQQLPLLIHCPVHFASGGGYTLTFPLAAGEEGLVVFSSRAIDLWWIEGGIQNQVELRMHSLDDGFFIPGFRSNPNVLPDISTTGPELRNAAGTVKIGLGPAGVTITSPVVTITGNLVVEGAINPPA